RSASNTAACTASVIFFAARRFWEERARAKSAIGSGTLTRRWSSSTAISAPRMHSGGWTRSRSCRPRGSTASDNRLDFGAEIFFGRWSRPSSRERICDAQGVQELAEKPPLERGQIDSFGSVFGTATVPNEWPSPQVVRLLQLGTRAKT